MTTERDADARICRRYFSGTETLCKVHGKPSSRCDDWEAGFQFRAQGDSASTLPEDRKALWEMWTGGEKLAYGCGFRDGRRDSATTEGAVRETAAAFMAHVQALACDHGTNAGSHTSCPEALALDRALLADVPDEGEGA